MENNFSKNLKSIREAKKISQQDIADKIGIDRSAISYWESGKADPTMGNVVKVAEALDVDIITLIGGELNFDNAELISTNDNTAKIPVLGVIKAGIPMEAQEDIIDYIDIPDDWTKGNQKYFALKISGDSMSPNYVDGDIVIFLSTSAFETGQDCAVMVNGDDATFKKVAITDNGLLLQPYNIGKYDLKFYTKEDVEKLPVKIIGVAKERRTKL